MIFLSYASSDVFQAQEVARRLRQCGMNYWIDSERLDLSGDVERQIHGAIRAASGLLVLDSPSSRSSMWVSLERAFAKSLGRREVVLPVTAAREPALP